MKNQNIIDCYKLDIIKDIPLEHLRLEQQIDDAISQNQMLKNILAVLGIGAGCVLLYKIVKNYGKKSTENEENFHCQENQGEYQYY